MQEVFVSSQIYALNEHGIGKFISWFRKNHTGSIELSDASIICFFDEMLESVGGPKEGASFIEFTNESWESTLRLDVSDFIHSTVIDLTKPVALDSFDYSLIN